MLVTQLGCDTHASDPLAHLRLTTNTYRTTARILHELAHEAAGGRWVATGGGGYQWARVVPRAWTAYFAEMADVELPDALPAAWVERTESMSGGPVPLHLVGASDRWSSPRMIARTKLVCTLGPATNTPAFVRGLVAAGTSIFRINFSHGAPDEHARAARLVREAEADAGRALAVLADLPGPRCGWAAWTPIRSGSYRGRRSTCVQTATAMTVAHRPPTRIWPPICETAIAYCWPTAPWSWK